MENINNEKNNNIINNTRYIINYLLSFELVFLLFLFAGRFKAASWLDWVGVDLTLLFLLISIVSGFVVLYKRGFNINHSSFISLILFLLFIFYVFLSLFWTNGNLYSKQKAIYIFTLVFWSFIGAIIIIPEKERLKRFFILLLNLSFIFVVAGIKTYMIDYNGGFVRIFGGNYLGLGYLVSLGSLLIIAFYLLFARNIFLKIISIILYVLFLYLLLVSGGRGPLLVSLIPLIALLIMGIKINYSCLYIYRYNIIIIFLVIFSISLLIFLIFNSSGFLTTINRLKRVFYEEGGDSSLHTRLIYYKKSIEFWLDNKVFGHGIGSFPILMNHGGVRLYPHNLFLEIMVELGFLGLIFFLIFTGYIFYIFFNTSDFIKKPWYIIIFLVFLNVFINAMISGDIPDNRFLFTVLGFMTINDKNMELFING